MSGDSDSNIGEKKNIKDTTSKFSEYFNICITKILNI